MAVKAAYELPYTGEEVQEMLEQTGVNKERLDGLESALSSKVDKVNGKGLSANDFTNEEKSKLASVDDGANKNVQGDWNESDSTKDEFIKNKPNLGVYATKTELQGVENKIPNVPSWAMQQNKPTYTPAEVNAIPSSQKGTANGVASLDSTGRVPSSQLPSYVDDVIEYPNYASFPQTGETGKIYIDQETNYEYRWSGTGYINISNPIDLDETPTDNSDKLVTSGGIKSALDQKANQDTTYSKTEVDAKLSDVAHIGDDDGQAVIPDFDAETDSLWKKAQTLSVDEQDIVSANLFNKASGNGMGRVVLKKNQSFASQVTQANTIYVIKYDYNLNDYVELPENCHLMFEGGSIIINNERLTSNIIDAIEGGMFPDIETAAHYNAQRFVKLINAGFSVNVNNTFYIGTASDAIINDVKVNGNGCFIKTSSAASFNIDASVSIDINGISFKANYSLSRDNFSVLFYVGTSTHIYNPLVSFKNCNIDNVRVYTHVADDVDQVTIKDGVEKFIFKNNIVKNIGYYCVRLGNCLSDYVEISNNHINKFCTCVFDLGVNNDYQLLSFPRMKNVIIHSNYIDNSGYILTDETYTSYHTPFIVEAGFCSFNNNTIKNVLCENNAAVAVYAAYLSVDKLEMRNNYIYNVINLANSTYNECFKAKGSTGGAYEKIICCNTYIISEDVLNGYSPSIKFFSLQTAGSNECNILNISNNFVDVSGCTFTWGAGSNIVYHNATISHNTISCKEVGVAACEMFRLADNTDLDGNIRIIGNRMFVKESPTQTASLIREAEGYSIYIEDNDLCNCIPYGSFNTNYTNLEIISKRNHFIQPGLARIYHATSVDDEIVFPNTSTGVIVYPDLLQDSYISFYLPSNTCFFNLDWSGANSIGLYKFTISCGLGESSVYCRADENTVLLINDAGKVITCSRTTTETQQIIGLSLSATISLGSIKVTGKEVTFEISQYAKSFKPKCTIEKYATLPNINAFGNKNLLSEASGADNNLRPYLVWKNNRIGYVQNGKMYNANGLHDAALSGTTSERPASSLGSGDKGFQYFDTTLNKPIYWTGSVWVDATGATV